MGCNMGDFNNSVRTPNDDTIAIDPQKDGARWIEGGDGKDTIKLNGSLSDFTFADGKYGIDVTHKTKPDFKLKASNIEHFEFADGRKISTQEALAYNGTNDEIVGTDKGDMIIPRGGNDYVSAGLGDDLIIFNPAHDGFNRVNGGEDRNEKGEFVESDKDRDTVMLGGPKSEFNFTNDGSAVIVTSKENPNFKLEAHNIESFRFNDGQSVSAQELEKKFQAEGRDTSKTMESELKEIITTLRANGVKPQSGVQINDIKDITPQGPSLGGSLERF